MTDLDTLMLGVLGGEDTEIDCDDCFAVIDRYVELERAGEPAEPRFPGFRAHLASCPACAEDYESLRALLELEEDSR